MRATVGGWVCCTTEKKDLLYYYIASSFQLLANLTRSEFYCTRLQKRKPFIIMSHSDCLEKKNQLNTFFSSAFGRNVLCTRAFIFSGERDETHKQKQQLKKIWESNVVIALQNFSLSLSLSLPFLHCVVMCCRCVFVRQSQPQS